MEKYERIDSGKYVIKGGRRYALGTYTLRRIGEKAGRNEPCPCGSGRKYKHCCLDKGEEDCNGD